MPAMSASPLTPLDYIAEGYWQDFLVRHPIAGGIAYEAELHNCQLDESLASLQRVDTLLSQIRRDMAKAGTWDEKALLVDERYRNLLVFLAFYAGRVLAQQWQNALHWYGQFELRARYPELPLITDNFYQHMAVLYHDASVSSHDIKSNGNESNNSDSSNSKNHNYKVIAPVFFALEPIGMRLFGHIDRQFQTVQGGQVASGLYQAVSARLPEVTPKTAPKVISVTTDTTLNNHAGDTLKPVVSPADNNMSTTTTLDAETDTRSSGNETQTIPILSENISSSPSSPSKKIALPIAHRQRQIFLPSCLQS